MKTLIGYYDEQGQYIEQLVDVIEKTNEELIAQKESELLAMYQELQLLKSQK
jgi:hypothetical protein